MEKNDLFVFKAGTAVYAERGGLVEGAETTKDVVSRHISRGSVEVAVSDRDITGDNSTVKLRFHVRIDRTVHSRTHVELLLVKDMETGISTVLEIEEVLTGSVALLKDIKVARPSTIELGIKNDVEGKDVMISGGIAGNAIKGHLKRAEADIIANAVREDSLS